MHFFIDSADLEEIRKIDTFFPVAGVTTNPSLVAKQNRAPLPLLEKIRQYIGERELHAQVVSLHREKMIEEAHMLVTCLGEKTCIKIPACPEGFAAMKQLAREGFSLTATAVYTPIQAMIAAECGALRVAPYVNRIDNLGFDGLAVVERIQLAYEKNGLLTKIVAASVKNVHQIERMCELGIYAVTLAPNMFPIIADHPETNAAATDFNRDLNSLV